MSEDVPRLEAIYQWLRTHPFEIDAGVVALATLGMLFIGAVDGGSILSWGPIAG